MTGLLGIVAQSDWVFVANNATYLLGGAVITVALTVASVLLGLAAGFPAGVVEVYGGGLPKRAVKTVGVVLRGTPIVVLLIFAFFVFPTPDIPLGFFTIGGAFVAGVLGLGLRSAAYLSQVFRGALQSVDEGQLEAARSVGMSRLQGIRYVVVPQALRRSVPGFQNEVTIVLKDTSVVFAIGLAEMLTRSYDLFVRQTSAVLEVILFVSAIYFVLTFTTNRALDYASDYYAIPEGN
ncbi:amino acid ABC transporter membrane protein 1, PAAT family (TC 3.A.1.3.-) [Halogranum gelatinilyticum]|uniref:Amino acid ABC transporter membrane protein 1, PAAT family (TC 3.A.1.3.-) n=1 Tax=Halogranum gelatinilyticum TaxID=660521 RepID=A0A1G9TJS6_9EURY|nr:amino acid ABC transporter permease [Halogranum gelatinilyticum]SDM47882.1 amino acid ABC transporter membrane protein 1, PAAT family (TC 3.A.1.3.-) [Halogranum gelatinilyticum]